MIIMISSSSSGSGSDSSEHDNVGFMPQSASVYQSPAGLIANSCARLLT